MKDIPGAVQRALKEHIAAQRGAPSSARRLSRGELIAILVAVASAITTLVLLKVF